jgi:hypothetical protein
MAPDDHSTTASDPETELTTTIASMVETLVSAGGVPETLTEVVSLAVSTIEGCDFAGIFLLEGELVTTPVCTDPIVIEIDSLQHQTGEGPCLDALHQGMALYACDLADDERWPRLGPAASTRGIRCLLGLPLPVNGLPGALNLYARYPEAFGVIDRGRGSVLATMAALALTLAENHEAEERRAVNLHAALSTREVIGQAQGILMERDRISSDEAFDILRRASQHLNLKLRDVAQGLVDTGEKPDTG